ncbi:MaoC/PaaZ C-terminal domain-containing protein [Rhodococcus koreensis]
MDNATWVPSNGSPSTRSESTLFTDATDDQRWIHTDPARAASGPFGTTFANGYLALSVLARMLEQLLQVADGLEAANCDLDRVRFANLIPMAQTCAPLRNSRP